MDPLTSMTTTRRRMRQNSQEYNDAPHKIHANTNTRINQMQKDPALFRYFIFTDMNNRMVTNYQRISVNYNTSYENPATCHSVPSTVPYNYMYKDTPACTHT